MKFDFNDIILTPSVISSINSRSEINPFDEHGMLPIMTAPMDTVVDNNNFEHFIDNKINVVLPRNKKTASASTDHNIFYSYGLTEFEETFLLYSDVNYINESMYALIDVANGNMQKLFSIIKNAKERYGNRLVLMVGNIANPKTFEEWCKVGVDYVRCGIGNGQACLTSANTGVGYPLASLISECYQIKKYNGYKTKIVSDGGFKNYSDINKALALGADYVMIGSMLNKALESCGKLYTENTFGGFYEEFDMQKFNHFYGEDANPTLLLLTNTLYKKYRGMSTKEVQKDWGKIDLKTSEGIVKYNKVEYTLKGFTENLTDYLKSAMSYTNSKTLEEFRGSNFELITENSFKRFNK